MDTLVPSSSLATALLAVAVALAGIGLIVLLLVRSRAWEDTSALGAEVWGWQVREICEEYGSLVDRLRPTRQTSGLPSTVALSEIHAGLRRLDAPLERLITEVPEGPAEALQDVGRVSLSLRSALQAERSIRLSDDQSAWPASESTTDLVLRRAAELEMAVQVVVWSIESR